MAADRGKLALLINEYETRLETLRAALAILDAEAGTKRAKRGRPVLDQAITMDEKRRAVALLDTHTNGNGNGAGKVPTNKQKGYNTKAAQTARRTRTAEFLARFDPVKPTPVPADFKDYGLGPLTVAGYLKRKGAGYVRTKKEFSITNW